MRGPDVLFIKPGSQKKLYGNLNDFDLTGIEPPFWGAMLAGYMRGRGYSVKMLDAEADELSYDETAARIVAVSPLLTVITVSGTNPSASTMNMIGASEIVKSLKKIDASYKTVFHGLHPSALPELTLTETKVDYVCKGEGFSSLPMLVDALKGGTIAGNIPGIWSTSGGSLSKSASTPVLADLNTLPPMAWDLLPMSKYRAHNWHCFDKIANRTPYAVLYTSLGCPYNCSFCCINAIFGKPGIRFRCPEKVVEDIDLLVTKYGVRNIKIMDELFAISEKRVLDICDRIIERKYDLNMWAYARVNTVTPLMLDRMKKAGINWVAYGFESANKKVLDDVSKSYDVAEVQKVIKMTYDAGLYICANFIFGLPEDDYDSMQESLDMAVDMNAEWANFYCTMAYPGSKLYDEAIEKSWPLPVTWSGFSQYSSDSQPLPTNHLKPGEVLAFRDYAFDAYFKNPRYLDKIRRLFGLDTVRHIQEMTKHSLIRNNKQF